MRKRLFAVHTVTCLALACSATVVSETDESSRVGKAGNGGNSSSSTAQPTSAGTAGPSNPSSAGRGGSTSTTVGGHAGGPASGGATNGGATNGGATNGGATNGGATNGGVGGTNSAKGGTLSSGAASGSSSKAGAGAGGNATGGNATGGNATGGNATGGNATGGNATGGNATGGVAGRGAGGSAGVATAGVSSGGGTSQQPSCRDDGSARSTEFIHPIYGCGHRFGAETSTDYWVVFDSGLHYDRKSGYGWYVLPILSSKSQAELRCAAETAAGITTWQLPTIEHVRSVADGCAPNTLGGTCRLGADCLSFSCGLDHLCDGCLGVQGPGKDGYYCRANAQLCPDGHTTGVCTDCAAQGFSPQYNEWHYVGGNGCFGVIDPNYVIVSYCVTPVVPNYR